MKDLEWPRSESGQGCRYDLILVARREVYDEVFDKLQVSDSNGEEGGVRRNV